MSAGPSKRTRRQPGAVDAVVVDAHDRALVHWHNAIRARQLPFSKIGLVHFDSHPDLGIPDHLQAATVFKPDELYQQIDIAEFILPAVFAGHVSHMLWIRPPWARQIADGKYTITVGRELISGLVKVHCGEQLLPYFVDDGATVEQLGALDGPSCKTLALCVAALPLVPAQHAFLSDASVSTWILDIDLDYFSTTNPWLQELAFRRPASLNGDLRVLSSVFLNAVWHADLISEADLPPGVDSAICVAISETPLVDSESIRSTAAYFDYRRKLASLLQLLCRLPSRSNSVAGQAPPDSEVSWLTFHDNQDRFVAAGSELLGSYLHQTHGPGVLRSFHELLQNVHQQHQQQQQQQQMAQQKLETVHKDRWPSFSVDDLVQTGLLLVHPHVCMQQTALSQAVSQVTHMLAAARSNGMQLPAFITIATSTTDGHTPASQASEIEQLVRRGITAGLPGVALSWINDTL